MPGDKWTCLGCVCHLREAVLQCLTSRCLAWLAGTFFPSTLPEAVRRQWNGLAEPSKVNTAGDVLLAPPRHSIPGVGGWASVHPRGPASSLVLCSETRGRRKGFHMWWRNYQLLGRASVGSAAVLEQSRGVFAQRRGQEQSFRSYCSPCKLPVASPVPMMCSVSWRNWERTVSVSALRLHK